MTHRSFVAASTVTLAAVVLLAGCSFSSTQLEILSAEKTSADELPVLREENAYEVLDTSTSRFVGEFEGIGLWLAEGKDSPACLIAIADDDEDWIIGCGGLPGRTVGLGHAFELQPDGALPPDGMTRISDNVYVD